MMTFIEYLHDIIFISEYIVPHQWPTNCERSLYISLDNQHFYLSNHKLQTLGLLEIL